MLHFTPDAYYTSYLLERCPKLVHGYSSRQLGDMRGEIQRKQFMDVLGIGRYTLIMSQQVHGNLVERIGDLSNVRIPLVDALVLKPDDFDRGTAIGVLTADCVPLLLADLKGKTIGVAHAGWKGSYKNIAAGVVRTMNEAGTESCDIVVSIGPHIGMCCYTVPEERARKFMSLYNDDPKVASFFDGIWHIDIGYINRLQLKNAGVKEENIDISITCTSCQNDRLYSYRKDSKETFGESIGVMAMYK